MTNIARATVIVLLAISFLPLPASAFEALSGELVIEGTGDSQALLRALAKRFEEIHPDTIVVVPESIGSGGGIRALIGNEVEMARVARPLTKEERKLGLASRAFALSPVVFAVHPSVEGIDNVSTSDVFGIYSGKTTRWEQLGGKPPFRIYPVGREDGDSSRTFLSIYIRGFETVKDVSKTVYSTPEAVDVLLRHKNTIGYVPMAMVKKSGLKILKLDDVYPSVENVKNGSYKVTAPLGFVYKRKLGPLARVFVDFLYGKEARKIIREYGCVPVNREN
jgi:phosphate transport system substrate-binding protein